VRITKKLGALDLFSGLQSGDGSTRYNPANRRSFLSQVDSVRTGVLGTESTEQEFRDQPMFRGMTASLDRD
jgi:hypothetical protein